MTASTDPEWVTEHLVDFLLFDGMQALDVVGPHEVFVGANQVADHLGRRGVRYRPRLVAREPGPVVSESGLRLVATWGLATGRVGTLIVPGGDGVLTARHDQELLDWVRTAAAGAERIASICTGTFLLAAAGLLTGRQVVTHWVRTEQLRREHPEIDVQLDPIYLRSGDVWTSAGVTAGLDLALAMVEDDLGADVAQAVARMMVMFARRPGGQTQFATPVWAPPAARPAVREAQDLVHAQPAADLRVPVLARRVGMSPRHFSREFSRLVGESPGEYVEKVRVEAARRMLEAEPVTVAVAALRCGFGSPETLRRAFVRRLGVAPDHYRRRFAVT